VHNADETTKRKCPVTALGRSRPTADASREAVQRWLDHSLSSALERMAGTTRLELATSAVTVHNLTMHLNAAESTELQRRIRVKGESLLAFLHYAALKIMALHGVERQGYDTKYVTESKNGSRDWILITEETLLSLAQNCMNCERLICWFELPHSEAVI
jgi:ferric-dicitrate binding protein FerR (iron transport regulator)